jgi:hypothetical protein
MGQPTLPHEARELVHRVAQSKALCLDCRRLVAQSRVLMATSRRHLNPHWRLSGASDDALRQTIRDGLDSGELFPVDGNGFGGRGRRQLCTVCDMPVLPADMEIRITEPRSARAHVACYAIWLEESNARRESRPKLARSRKRPGLDGSA